VTSVVDENLAVARTYDYDANGAVTEIVKPGAGTTQTLARDDNGWVEQSCIGPSSCTEYRYDVGGTRVRKTSTSVDQLFVTKGYDVDLHANRHFVHLFAGTKRVATIERSGIGTAAAAGTFTDLKYYLANHVGSNTLVLNYQGGVEEEIVLSPFGEQLNVPSGGSAPGSTRYVFTDQYRDTESGLDYFGARYYDPFVGRFLSFDPESFAGGVTFGRSPADGQYVDGYAYARNRPTVLTDPTGRYEFVWAMTCNGKSCSSDGGSTTSSAASRPMTVGRPALSPLRPQADSIERENDGATQSRGQPSATTTTQSGVGQAPSQVDMIKKQSELLGKAAGSAGLTAAALEFADASPRHVAPFGKGAAGAGAIMGGITLAQGIDEGNAGKAAVGATETALGLNAIRVAAAGSSVSGWGFAIQVGIEGALLVGDDAAASLVNQGIDTFMAGMETLSESPAAVEYIFNGGP